MPFAYNGCGRSFSATTTSNQANQVQISVPTPGPITPQPPSPPPPSNQKNIILAVGTGGLHMLSSDGFKSFESHAFDVSGTLNLVTAPNCMDSNTTVINNKCCYQDQWSCYAGNGHSDFHLRDVTYGQGKFVAVGGAGFGISRTSVDGNNWSNRYLWTTGNSFILQGKPNPSFITSIIYRQGEFFALAGFGALLYHSVDGINWTNESIDIGGVFGNLIFTGTGFFASGQNGDWAFSKDGKTWDAHGTHPDQLRIYDPVSNGQIVLAREEYTNSQTKFIIKNADNSGVWSFGQTISAKITKLIYSPLSKKFYAYAQGKVYVTSDGQSWQTNNLNINTVFTSAFASSQGFFLAQNYNWQTAESKIYQSTDGVNWSLVSSDGPGLGQNIFNFLETAL